MGFFPFGRACITELTQVIDVMLLLVAPRSSDQVNSLWPREAIWWHGSRSTLAQVMACCLKAPSHFLNQCCVLICEVLWHSLDRNFTESAQAIVLYINTLRPRQNGRHFADDIFKRIFLNQNVWIPIETSLKFVPKGSINNNPALFQIMAWRRPGDKSLSEPIMASLLLTHICVTRPQWVKSYF